MLLLSYKLQNYRRFQRKGKMVTEKSNECWKWKGIWKDPNIHLNYPKRSFDGSLLSVAQSEQIFGLTYGELHTGYLVDNAFLRQSKPKLPLVSWFQTWEFLNVGTPFISFVFCLLHCWWLVEWFDVFEPEKSHWCEDFFNPYLHSTANWSLCVFTLCLAHIWFMNGPFSDLPTSIKLS